MGFFGFGRSPEGATHEEPTDKKKDKRKSGWKVTLPNRYSAIAAAAVMLGVGGAGLEKRGGEEPEPGHPHIELKSQAARDAIEAAAETANPESQVYAYEGSYWPIVDTVNGEASWTRVFEPGYLVVSKAETQPQHVSFSVPYEYARFFDTGQPIDPVDYEKMMGFMEEQIWTQLAEGAIGMSWDLDDYESKNGAGPEGLVVKSIEVKGTASPEAGMGQGGPETVAPGHVEIENVELGSLRATDATDRLVEVLGRLGIKAENAPQHVSSDELQFSPGEYRELESMGRTQGFDGTADQVIFQLITKYNRDQLTNAGMVKQLDGIVGSKRAVEIDVELENGKKDSMAVPLPLLGLLLLMPGIRRREEKEKTPEKHPVERSKADLTKDVLDKWTENDNAIRQNAGLEPELHHENRPRQVLYAELHAVALNEAAKWAREHGKPADAETWNTLEVRKRAADAMRQDLSDPAKIAQAEGKTVDEIITDVEMDLAKNYGFYESMVNSVA